MKHIYLFIIFLLLSFTAKEETMVTKNELIITYKIPVKVSYYYSYINQTDSFPLLTSKSIVLNDSMSFKTIAVSKNLEKILKYDEYNITIDSTNLFKNHIIKSDSSYKGKFKIIDNTNSRFKGYRIDIYLKKGMKIDYHSPRDNKNTGSIEVIEKISKYDYLRFINYLKSIGITDYSSVISI